MNSEPEKSMNSESGESMHCLHSALSTKGRSLTISAAFALTFIVMAEAMKWAAPTYISDDLARRLFGILLDAFVVWSGNAVPKVLTPLARLRCSPQQEQAARRFVGWTLVLAGLAAIGAWIFAPIDDANIDSMAILATGLVVAMLRYIWAFAEAKRR